MNVEKSSCNTKGDNGFRRGFDSPWSHVSQRSWDTERMEMSGFNNMTEVKIAAKNAGSHWFSTATVESFKSKVETPLLGRRYWIESTDNHDRSARRFMIARIDEITCDISYLSIDYTTLRFDTLKDAETVLRGMEVGV